MFYHEAVRVTRLGYTYEYDLRPEISLSVESDDDYDISDRYHCIVF